MDVPEVILQRAAERDRARSERDFARADALRDAIVAAGYLVKDTPSGTMVEPAPRFVAVDPASIQNHLTEPATLDLSLHLLYEGFRSDVERFCSAFQRHAPISATEVVLVDNASEDGIWIEDVAASFPFVRTLHLDRECGWATARNAGLKLSRGRVIVLVDLSIEPTGDVVTPLLVAFADASVGLAGPFGLVSEDMRDWQPAQGPEAAAIEGYLLAARREGLAKGLIHERFKWYRNADIDLSFQLRALGYRALTVSLPLRKHAHRGWEALDDTERAKRSKRNHYLFFDRWKNRMDLLTTGG